MSADLTVPPNLPLAPPDRVPDLGEYPTEDGAPVDNFFHASQMDLLVEPLKASWVGPGGGRPFLITANVGVYHTVKKPAVVPDVMLALDVQFGSDQSLPQNRTYFIWEVGKPPDVVIEIVSPTDGGETTHKMELYARIGIEYYAVFDPEHHLQPDDLQVFARRDGKYRPVPAVPLGDLGLGLTVWEGTYDGMSPIWLRWTDAAGNLIPTGAERAALESQRADDATLTAKAAVQRADREKQRADAMAEKLARYEARLRGAGLPTNGD
ncbi:MAG TPA: Uma2 family endonuclease [Gemmataceae bacterium]|nr:Uma2 family endonuclease [Gemmataceae bacterium]